MIKRIIFDIDNTLIDFPKDYEVYYQQILDKYNVRKTALDLYRAIGSYEDSFENKQFYDKEKLLETINIKLGVNLGKDFIDDYLKMYSKLITKVSENVIDTLEYLSNKYEVVALSNWFTSNQKERMEYAGILSYFDEVYGADIVPIKPNKESFLYAIKDRKLDECLMIGDSIRADIKVPYEMGMNVYYLSLDNNTEYPTINSIERLKEIL